MNAILIKNAMAYIDQNLRKTDILVENEKISRIADSIIAENGMQIIDGEDQFLLPGFIDIHTHLADHIGEFELADDYESGSKEALLNGITTIYSFITQTENKSLPDCISATHSKMKGKSYCDVGWHLTPTDYSKSNLQELKTLLQNGFHSIKLYTTYREKRIVL